MRKKRIIAILILAVSSFCCSGMCSFAALAEGAGGGTNQGGVNTDNQIKCEEDGGDGGALSHCHGGGWWWYSLENPGNGAYYDATNDQVVILNSNGTLPEGVKSGNGSKQGVFPGGVINGCGEVGGFYRLAPFWYGQLGNQGGLLPRNNFQGLGENFPMIPGDYDDTKVMQEFAIAKKAIKSDGSKVIPDDITESNVSGFCYDEKLKEMEAEVHARATVSVNNGVYDLSETSEEEGYVGLKIALGAGQDTVEVNFEHTFYFRPTSDYNVSYDGKPFKADYKYTHPDFSNAKSRTWESATGINVSELKESRKATISFTGDNANAKVIEVCSSVTDYKINLNIKYDGTIEYPRPGTTGTAKACITVTRPDLPGPSSNSVQPIVSGRPGTETMFIGEASELSWNTSATTTLAHRLKGYTTVSYLVSPGLDSDTGMNAVTGINYYNYGTTGNTHTPCDFFTNKLTTNIAECGASKKDGGSRSKTYANTNVYAPDLPTTAETKNQGKNKRNPTKTFVYPNPTQDIVVPAEFKTGVSSVGAKYCTTFAYRFKYYYAVNKSGLRDVDADRWHKVDGKDYWYIFDSACTPIAKRPQAAVWNGSVFAIGNINTSLSTQYQNTGMHTILSQGGDTTTYGSWAEYMAISNGVINNTNSTGFISGKSGSYGVDKSTVGVDANSSLTIANDTSVLGKAGIDPNGAFSGQVQSYFIKNEKINVNDPGSTLTGIDNTGTGKYTGTVVYKHTGDLNITGNIIANDSYVALTDIPQAIIYVDGNLNISSNVERIDAWLIVTRKINTCAEFENGKTGASSDNVCTKRLTINGPVSAKSVVLNRTKGENGVTGPEGDMNQVAPAEVFNFPAAIYAWSYERSKNNGDDGGYRYNEVHTRELAPRS